MISASFRIRDDKCSFLIKGHSGSAEQGRDIICASVSSAAYLTANTLTEIFGKEAKTVVKDGYMSFTTANDEIAVGVIKGLELHIRQLEEQYPGFIKITTEE